MKYEEIIKGLLKDNKDIYLMSENLLEHHEFVFTGIISGEVDEMSL